MKIVSHFFNHVSYAFLQDKMLCQCKHAQSLWIALSLEQTKHNSSYKEVSINVLETLKKSIRFKSNFYSF